MLHQVATCVFVNTQCTLEGAVILLLILLAVVAGVCGDNECC